MTTNYQPYLTRATYIVGPDSDLAFGLSIDVTKALSDHDVNGLLVGILNALDAELVTVKCSRDEWERISWMLAGRALFTILNDTAHYATPITGTRGLDRGILVTAIASVTEDTGDISMQTDTPIDPTLLRARAHRTNNRRDPSLKRQDDRLREISDRITNPRGMQMPAVGGTTDDADDGVGEE